MQLVQSTRVASRLGVTGKVGEKDAVGGPVYAHPFKRMSWFDSKDCLHDGVSGRTGIVVRRNCDEGEIENAVGRGSLG